MRNNIFYERLKILSKYHEKSINEIEKDLGYPRNALHNYKAKSIPSAARLMELSQYFNVTPEYLIGMTEKRNYGAIRQTVALQKLMKRMRSDILELEVYLKENKN